MANLSTHYKEVSPEQTVENVKKFFTSNNLTVKECDIGQSEAGTWYLHVDLYKNGNKLCGANGKGMTREYAFASGYAELYERFCNGMTFLGNPWWNMAVTKQNHDKYGYYLRADEKLLSYDELTSGWRIQDFLERFCADDESLKKAIINYMTQGKYIGLPMHNIADENDVLYFDPRVLLRMQNSVGMAAGNTIDEALNQGISELFEKYAEEELFKNWDVPHYALKLENIQNEHLQKVIHNIQSLDYDLYIFDLSYNYSVPTVMSLIIDKKRNILNMNFGSFPVFDIAAERVLTELYQGISSYRTPDFLMQLQIPYKTLTFEQAMGKYCNCISGEIFPEDFFKNLEYKEYYNSKVFFDKNATNAQMREYYTKIANDLNIKLYYLDNSLSPNIHAVYIFPEGEKAYRNYSTYHAMWNKISSFRAKDCLNKLTALYNGIYNNKVNYPDFLNVISLVNYDDHYILINKVRMWNDFCISENNGNQYNNFFSLMPSDNDFMNPDAQETIPFDIINNFLYVPFRCYQQLQTYIRSNKYSNEELLDIFNNFFNYNITIEDINKACNMSYVLKKAYVEPMYNYLHSNDYQEIINTFTK